MKKCRICDAQIPSHAEMCPVCGAPVPKSAPVLSAEVEQELLQLLCEGNDLEAVARYRDATGVTLVDAKRAVQQLRKGSAAPTGLDERFQKELLDLVAGSKKIQAIKLYREHAGCGLAEAKAAVEGLAVRHGVVGQSGGCATVLAILLIVAMGAASWIAWGVTASG